MTLGFCFDKNYLSRAAYTRKVPQITCFLLHFLSAMTVFLHKKPIAIF